MAKSLDRRLSSLELAEREETQWRVQRTIVEMILDEVGRDGIDLAQAIQNVVDDQYSDLGAGNRETIAQGWTRTIGNWSRLDWLATIGRVPEL